MEKEQYIMPGAVVATLSPDSPILGFSQGEEIVTPSGYGYYETDEL